MTSRNCEKLGILHNFKVIERFPDAQKEYCTRCKGIEVTKLNPLTGELDAIKYLKLHERDFLQRNNPRFKYEYKSTKDNYLV